MNGLVWGLLGTCVVCGHGAGWWYAHGDQYRCAHPTGRCLEQLTDTLEELDRAATTAARSGPARGAWARIAGAAVPTGPRADGVRRGVGQGSPFFVPGMIEGAPWVAIAETNFGHLTCVSATEAHARKVAVRYRALAAIGRDVSLTGSRAVAGAVVDPTGALSDEWGDRPITLGSPRWTPITMVSQWMRCAGCGRALWPGSVVTVTTGRCRGCTAPGEAADPRPWPSEPRDPGMIGRPEYLGGPKPVKRATAKGRES